MANRRSFARAGVALGIVGAGALALGIKSFLQYRRLAVAVEANGPFHLLSVERVRGAWQVATTALLPWAEAGNSAFEVVDISVAPGSAMFAYTMNEYVADGTTDQSVTILSVAGVQILRAIDQSHPTVIIRGDEPNPPPQLQAAQAAADADWEIARQDDPTIPRFIVTGQLDDEAGDGELGIGGWLKGSSLYLAGRTRLRLMCAELWGEYLGELEDWWMVAAPAPRGGGWHIAGSGIGELPSTFGQVTNSRPQPVASLLAGGLLALDGQQVSPDIGPFTHVSGCFRA